MSLIGPISDRLTRQDLPWPPFAMGEGLERQQGEAGARAVLSADGAYRYYLRRVIAGDRARRGCFVLLNPSTADALVPDPTLTRCLGFARREGCAVVELLNLYAWRSKDPRELLQADEPVGPLNDDAIRQVARMSDLLVVAWGATPNKARRARARQVAELLHGCRWGAPIYCLGTSAGGAPRHPLYLPSAAPLTPWELP